ncbi:nucleotidyltransferase [Alteribacillus iranensis]|uniref:tRNA(Met) cytidine acetate ligase n=1 Tax=Alteribacillus iranensis TaxID=930128 RepID=A0A1I2ABY9_9BACI|nr:nucleotidyltransferase [Alteribacillus iranensis]SFE41247.1 Predicted nucleotidyltransferase [Alteribacillus iranensis]
MKAVGLIVEYNPFHNGHYYHIHSSKEKTKADVVVCVMSGYFLQRGEPALLPRRERTKMALEGGADVVVELPYIFSSQHASWFARGAVSILHHLGVDSLCFGSEHGDIQPFLELQSFLRDNKEQYNRYIKYYSSQGNSYPKAASLAFSALEPDHDWPDLTQPNNILGYHYIQAIYDLKSSIQPETIQRKQAGYHEEHMSDHHIASATSIRRSLTAGSKKLDDVAHTVPKTTLKQLESFVAAGNELYDWERYFPFLQAKALTMSVTQAASLYEANEGLHHRFLSCIQSHDSFHAFLKELKTKRYTWTRLQRLAVHFLTGTERKEVEYALRTGQADHIRLLGMNKKGQAYLNNIKKHLEIPLTYKLTKKKTAQQILDERAAKAYYIPLPPRERIQKWQEEFQFPPVIIREE